MARSVDAGWIPTFGLVAGVVVETGGDLSHGSIILREIGLPAITNAHHATLTFGAATRSGCAPRAAPPSAWAPPQIVVADELGGGGVHRRRLEAAADRRSNRGRCADEQALRAVRGRHSGLTTEEIPPLLAQLDGWTVVGGKRLAKTYGSRTSSRRWRSSRRRIAEAEGLTPLTPCTSPGARSASS